MSETPIPTEHDAGLAPLPPQGGRGVGERGRKRILRTLAKQMRSAPTEAEHRLWQIFRAKRLSGYKFKRQLPIDNYIVDFACVRHRLIVEADGGQHSDNARDLRRDAYLIAQGFRILRFWNNDIFENEEGAVDDLGSARSPSPQPLSR